MSKQYARSMFAVAAAVLAAIPGVTPVLAATSWTVRPGGPVSMKSGKFVLKDTTTAQALTCQSSALGGALRGGSGLPGTGIGSIMTVGFTNCSGPLGFRFTLQARDLPWHLNFSSYNAMTGVVTGSLSHLQMKLSFPGCTAVIDGTSGTASDGSVKVSYADSTGVLQTRTAGGNLHFYNVRGCAGLVVTGDSATIGATSAVSPEQTITSP